jgi:hypothetical protein
MTYSILWKKNPDVLIGKNKGSSYIPAYTVYTQMKYTYFLKASLANMHACYDLCLHLFQIQIIFWMYVVQVTANTL